jgi:hypothetical protein
LTEGEEMKTRNTITKLIAITMAVAAIAIIGSSLTAGRARAAGQQDGGLQLEMSRSLRHALYGFIPGQSLSCSVANTPTQEEGGGPVRVQAYIYDSFGKLLSRTDPVEVPEGQFRTLRFNRDELPLAGEPDTGRVQVRAVIQVAFMDGSVRPFRLPVSIELVDNRTGATIGGSYSTGYVKVSDDGPGD